MKILFNTNSSAATASIFVPHLSERFEAAGYSVVKNDWENYGSYDVIFFFAPDSEVRKAKRINPKARICLFPKIVTKRHRDEAAAADFLIIDTIEGKDAVLPYNRNIIMFPPFLQMPFQTKEHIKKEPIIIGYHGNKQHLETATDLSRALDSLSERYPIEFWAVYNVKNLGKWKKSAPKKCPVRHIQWTENVYQEELSKCDIGVCPAKIPIAQKRTRLFSRFLSSFFWNWPHYHKLDYMLRFKYSTNPGRVYPFNQLSIPVVAEFVPSFSQVIQDGHSGFLVHSALGWEVALEKLIQNHELRNEMSRNLKKFLNEYYSPEETFQKLLKFLSA